MAHPHPDSSEFAARQGDPCSRLVRSIARLAADESRDRTDRWLSYAEAIRVELSAEVVEVWLLTARGDMARIGAPRQIVRGTDATRWRARLANSRCSVQALAESPPALDAAILGAGGVLGALRGRRTRGPRKWNDLERTLLATAADRLAVDLEARSRGHGYGSPELGRVVQGFAHDLGNTLTTALGHVQLIAQSQAEPAAGESARHAMVALDFACELAHQLRRLGDGGLGAFETLSPNAVVRGIDRLLRAVVGRDRRLDLDLESDIPPVMGDPRAIARLLVNLVTNARDATAPNGAIRIATSTHDDVVQLTVRDDGEGMEERVSSRMFEPGFSTKREHGGSGLGLAAVRGIADAHAAEIAVDSTPGGGTTITLRIPRADESGC